MARRLANQRGACGFIQATTLVEQLWARRSDQRRPRTMTADVPLRAPVPIKLTRTGLYSSRCKVERLDDARIRELGLVV
jgi:hypothetical protein